MRACRADYFCRFIPVHAGAETVLSDSDHPGVELLKEKEMETRIPLEGDDELTRLAETINFVAASRRELDQRERQMQEEKEAWVRSMSHDIRTPLTSMVSYSELLLDKENPEPEELERRCTADA